MSRRTLGAIEYDTGSATIIARLPDGTEVTLGSGGSSVGGSNGQVQWNNAGSFGGALKLTTNGNYLGIGTVANLAATGDLRFAKSFLVTARNNAGSGDLAVLQTDASDNIIVGATLTGAKTVLKGATWTEFWAPQHKFYAADGVTPYLGLSSTVAELYTDFGVWEPTLTHRFTFKQPATLGQDTDLTIRDPGVATDALVTEKTTQELSNKTIRGPLLEDHLGASSGGVLPSDAQTTNATPIHVSACQITPVNGDCLKVKVEAVWGIVGGTDCAYQTDEYLIQMRGGVITNPSAQGISAHATGGLAGSSVVLDIVSGPAVSPKLTGIAATTINWSVKVTYQKVAAP